MRVIEKCIVEKIYHLESYYRFELSSFVLDFPACRFFQIHFSITCKPIFLFKMTARKVLTGEIADLLQHTEAIQSENMTFRYMLGVDGKYKH